MPKPAKLPKNIVCFLSKSASAETHVMLLDYSFLFLIANVQIHNRKKKRK